VEFRMKTGRHGIHPPPNRSIRMQTDPKTAAPMTSSSGDIIIVVRGLYIESFPRFERFTA
jgi:hypothetical protein